MAPQLDDTLILDDDQCTVQDDQCTVQDDQCTLQDDQCTLQNDQCKPQTEIQNDSKTDFAFTIPASPTRKRKQTAVDGQKSSHDLKKMLITLERQLAAVLAFKPEPVEASSAVENTDPSSQPFFWVSKWVDYSDRYGFGYQLSDGSIGVMYNDETRLIMLADKFSVHYTNYAGTKLYCTVKNYPVNLEKKMKLMKFFFQYMNEHLSKACSSVAIESSHSLSRVPYIKQWFRTQTAVVMLLTNGSVQINFFDHTKIIMSPLMAAVTYIDQEKNSRTYRFESIKQNGCIAGLAKNLEYAHEKIGIMITNFPGETRSDNRAESRIKRARFDDPAV